MTRVVEIRTGARLHFGLFETSAASGRQGGIGMMIDRPGWRLRASVASEVAVVGDEETAQRIERYLAQLRKSLGLVGCLRIEVLAMIPAHRGLGSGTQLALALGRLLAELSPTPKASSNDYLGRGKRSLVGSIGIDQGGFIVDPGSQSPLSFTRPRIVAVPEDWRIMIIEPLATESCSGLAEEQAFAGLKPLENETRARLAQLVERRILPGLEQHDFHNFAAGLTAFNRLVGEQFARAQGGIYSHHLIQQLAQRLKETEWPYLAQSSWGSAAAVFCESDDSAARLEVFLDECLDGAMARLRRAVPRNQGVEIVAA